MLFGAKKVYYTDIDKRKLEFAKTLGFYEWENGTVTDCALEGTGYSDALQKCLETVKPHGRMVLMGNPAGEVTIYILADSPQGAVYKRHMEFIL